MALHDDLLALAKLLVPDHLPPYPPSPVEANLRRGVSTAYYALFHLLVGEATTRIVADPTLRSRVSRSFEHKRMKYVCQEYSDAKADQLGQFTTESGVAIPIQLRNVGTAFVYLQNARHQADYGTATVLTHAEADTHVVTAAAAFLDWATIRADPAAGVFLTELFLRSLPNR